MSDNKDLYTALSKAQGAVENAKKLSNNPHFKSRYADLATIWDAIREPLTSNGISVLQLPCEAPDGAIGLMTIIGHSSGQSVSSNYFCKLKDASNPQQVGSALTYMKRYTLLGVAGIASEDDDAEAAVGRPAAKAKSTTDWGPTIKEALKALSDCKTDKERGELYAEVRNSSIEEPFKAQLLNDMYASIQKARGK